MRWRTLSSLRPLTNVDMQLFNRIYQVSGDLTGLTTDVQGAMWNDCNSYVVRLDDGLVLFDAGCGDTMDQLMDNVRYWGMDPGDIAYCFLTHAHYDHAGGGHILKERGVHIVAGPETADAVQAGDHRCCGYLYHKTFNPFEVDTVLGDGEHISVLGLQITARAMPGHSQGCTVYSFEMDGKQVLISGDVIGTKLVGDFGWSGSIDFCRKAYLESLLRMTELDVDCMLPGHGMVYFSGAKRRIEEVLNTALMEWRQ